MDACRDNEENAFSKSMRNVYQACAQDKNRKNITKRTFFRIGEHLAQATNKSPFEAARKDILGKIIRVHRDSIVECIRPCLAGTLGRLRASLDDLSDNTADEAELAAKKELRRILPDLQSDLESARQEIKKVKKKYEDSQ